MLEVRLLLLLLTVSFAPIPSFCREPYAMRISCGASADVYSSPSGTRWHKDFGYTGGMPSNATRPSMISPSLVTVRYFPLSDGPDNCYNIKRVPNGHYLVRIYFGLISGNGFDNEPLFDVSVEGTLIYSLQPGWSNHNPEHAFVEALVFLKEGTVSICFHSTGHGDPAILAIEILEIDEKAYYFGKGYGQHFILRTSRRLNCGSHDISFGADYRANHWGGDRFWNSNSSFGNNDRRISTRNSINNTSQPPNFYPGALYQTALVNTDSESVLEYTMEVEPTRNYSLWLHFVEIDPLVTRAGERVFEIRINDQIIFPVVDIVSMAGGINTALVLNKTVTVDGRSLTITLHPKKGNRATISGIELLELIEAESRTSPDEISFLQDLKSTLGLPLRFGWNGDPCVPQQHPWTGVDCLYDRNISKYVIDGLILDNQGLRGSLPNDLSSLTHLQIINLSGNSISGEIPSSLGNITRLKILDLSFNCFNGSIPERLGQLTSLQNLELNSNLLSGRVPPALLGRLLHGTNINFTDNSGLCGIPGLPTCGPHLSVGAKIGIALAACVAFLLISTCLMCCWKRRRNILLAKKIAAARNAPYAKAKTHFNQDMQITIHHSHQTAVENGPSLLS